MQQSLPEANNLDLTNVKLHLFKSTGILRQLVVWLLYLIIVLIILSMISLWLQINLLNKINDEQQFFMNDLERNNIRHGTIVGLLFLLFLFTSIIFIVWTYRTYKNINALTTYGTERSPIWSVLGWFIPFINLFYPYLIMREIWRESLSRDNATKKVGDLADSLGQLQIWWGSFLVFSLLFIIAAFIRVETLDADTIYTQIYADYFRIVILVIGLIPAYLVIQIVKRIDDRQRTQYHLLSASIPKDRPSDNNTLSSWSSRVDGEPNATDNKNLFHRLIGFSSWNRRTDKFGLIISGQLPRPFTLVFATSILSGSLQNLTLLYDGKVIKFTDDVDRMHIGIDVVITGKDHRDYVVTVRIIRMPFSATKVEILVDGIPAKNRPRSFNHIKFGLTMLSILSINGLLGLISIEIFHARETFSLVFPTPAATVIFTLIAFIVHKQRTGKITFWSFLLATAVFIIAGIVVARRPVIQEDPATTGWIILQGIFLLGLLSGLYGSWHFRDNVWKAV